MKLVFFDSFKLGAVRGDAVVDISDAVADIPRVHPQDVLRGVIEGWPDLRDRLEDVVKRAEGVPLTSVRLRPPVPRPSNIDCMAANYIEGHTESQHASIDAFHKSPNAIIGDNDTMVLPDVPAVTFEGEAELALVIGKTCRNVVASDAMEYVFGFMNFVDGSSRIYFPPRPSFFYQMKSRDTFAPIGPFIVTADEVPDPQNLDVKLWNNGHLMQDFSTSGMVNDIARCIEFVSALHTLEPGDILATGTDHRGLNPFMDGDEIEMEVGEFGRLHIKVQDDLKRTWERGTRYERFEREERLKSGSVDPSRFHLRVPIPQLSGKYAEGDSDGLPS